MAYVTCDADERKAVQRAATKSGGRVADRIKHKDIRLAQGGDQRFERLIRSRMKPIVRIGPAIRSGIGAARGGMVEKPDQ